jgi:radical SAM enzyme (TIGR01210 family)
MHDNRTIEQLRPAKNLLNPEIPYHFLHEQEPGADGNLQEINTIFLTNKECSFKCLMCDLWKNTLDGATKPGDIVKQIDYALDRLPPATVIKLYNSGNFFDTKAIPVADYPAIMERLQSFNKVIVENHPKLCDEACVEFSRKLPGKFEIAMGLETIHPDVLPKLNKQITPEDFKRAAGFLRENEIGVRAFVLLNPPYLTDKKENIDWVLRTLQFAFESGAGCCTIIPTRSGNGIMETLFRQGDYSTPSLDIFEEVFEKSLALKKGLVFADTWDIGFLSDCAACFDSRKNRLEEMSLRQRILQPVICNNHSPYA